MGPAVLTALDPVTFSQRHTESDRRVRSRSTVNPIARRMHRRGVTIVYSAYGEARDGAASTVVVAARKR